MCAAGHTCVQSNPAHVAAHDLHDEDAVVGLRRRVQAVDRIRCHRYRGIEAEGIVRGVDVIVNGLRHAYNGDAIIVEPLSTLERAFAADGNEGIDLGLAHIRLDLLQAGLKFIGVQPAGAQNGAAAQENPVDTGIVVKIAPAVF